MKWKCLSIFLVLGTAASSAPPTISSQFRRIVDLLPSTLSSQSSTIDINALNSTNVLAHTNLSNLTKNVVVVTTASLPWMTGTAVNPLLRASHLARRRAGNDSSNHGICTLVVPFLSDINHQRLLFKNETFHSTLAQENYIRQWLRNCGEYSDPSHLQILFYPAVFDSFLKSIFPLGDLPKLCSSGKKKKDDDTICILEEPEHLNWYRAPGDSWRDVFSHTVGIIHTNYKAYAAAYGMVTGVTTGTAIEQMSALMMRAHCDRIILLSDTLNNYAPERTVTSNVHGVRKDFFSTTGPPTDLGKDEMIYFIGKLLWAKGLDLMLDLETSFRKIKHCDEYFPINVYGGGPDEDEIQRAFLGRKKRRDERGGEESNHERYGSNETSNRRNETTSIISSFMNLKRNSKIQVDWPSTLAELRRKPIPAIFNGPIDHACLENKHSIFVNPSLSEVLCTTAAEALAMGKFVILPNHPSNKFFLQFPNCLSYSTKREFVESLDWARKNRPAILGEKFRHLLSWEAATDRLCEATSLSERDKFVLEGRRKADERIAKGLRRLGEGKKGDLLRATLGAGAAAKQVHFLEMTNIQQLRYFSDADLIKEMERRQM